MTKEPDFKEAECLVPDGNMIKDKPSDFSPLTGILITDGPGCSRLTGKAWALFKIQRRIGFLKSSCLAINMNSSGLAARANKIGYHQVRCGATMM